MADRVTLNARLLAPGNYYADPLWNSAWVIEAETHDDPECIQRYSTHAAAMKAIEAWRETGDLPKEGVP